MYIRPMGCHPTAECNLLNRRGHTAERCNIRSIFITKLADLASPLLMQNCAAGRTLPKARIEFLRADGNGERVKYYEVELDNVLIGSVSQAIHQGDILQDSVSLKFSKVHWKYTQQRVAGGVGGNTSGGWDLATNRIA